MTANTAAVQSVEGRTVCTCDKENIQPPREYLDSSMRPRPAQPQPTVCGLVRHQLGSQSVNQGVQSGNLQPIDKLSGSGVLHAHTSVLQRQDTLPWLLDKEDAPRPVYTQPSRPTQQSVAAT